ncbi:exonuclease V [Dipodascopsis uninucleata]
MNTFDFAESLEDNFSDYSSSDIDIDDINKLERKLADSRFQTCDEWAVEFDGVAEDVATEYTEKDLPTRNAEPISQSEIYKSIGLQVGNLESKIDVQNRLADTTALTTNAITRQRKGILLGNFDVIKDSSSNRMSNSSKKSGPVEERLYKEENSDPEMDPKLWEKSAINNIELTLQIPMAHEPSKNVPSPSETYSPKISKHPYLDSNEVPSSTILSKSDQDQMLPLKFSEAKDLANSMLETYKHNSRLQVSDLVGPSWCELQYFYRYYKNEFTRTEAMKKGSSIHKVLEDEVSIPLPSTENLSVREDLIAVDLLAMLSSLQVLTLNSLMNVEQALIREFRVYGFFEGILVTGIIDEVSFQYDRPHPEGIEFYDSKHFNDHKDVSTMENSSTMQDVPQHMEMNAESLNSLFCRPRDQKHVHREIRIADSKTRRTCTYPLEAQRQTTYYQLLLYRKMFEDLTNQNFNYEIWAQKMRVNLDLEFSNDLRRDFIEGGPIPETFEAEINYNVKQEDEYYRLLTEMNSLRDIWKVLLMKFSEFRGKLSNQITTVYVWQQDSQIFGGIDYTYNENDLRTYVTDILRYWRAERDPKGVEVEEAYKCRACVFADRCSWRAEKIRESTIRNRNAFRQKISKFGKYSSYPQMIH